MLLIKVQCQCCVIYNTCGTCSTCVCMCAFFTTISFFENHTVLLQNCMIILLFHFFFFPILRTWTLTFNAIDCCRIESRSAGRATVKYYPGPVVGWMDRNLFNLKCYLDDDTKKTKYTEKIQWNIPIQSVRTKSILNFFMNLKWKCENDKEKNRNIIFLHHTGLTQY